MESELRPFSKMCSEKTRQKNYLELWIKSTTKTKQLLLNSCFRSITKAEKVLRNKQERTKTVPKSPRCRLQKLKVIIVRHF